MMYTLNGKKREKICVGFDLFNLLQFVARFPMHSRFGMGTRHSCPSTQFVTLIFVSFYGDCCNGSFSQPESGRSCMGMQQS